MIRTIAAAAVLTLTVSALPAYADDDSNVAAPAIAVPARISQSLSRPAALPVLYASYAALQAFDVYSTRAGLARGAREANPLMQGVVGNTSAFVAVKAGVGVATFMAAERLWKTNKAAAIAVMVASNGISAVVAARNARTLSQLRD
jgi:uncharacterized protein DUF5658